MHSSASKALIVLLGIKEKKEALLDHFFPANCSREIVLPALRVFMPGKMPRLCRNTPLVSMYWRDVIAMMFGLILLSAMQL